ncbi:hypothetical protein F5B20DRAFT_167600 [Whalleya microplaca]|nr:hypothetical protein F5B20DRAFT_167600 [Whalleya microplaca]
MKSNNIHYVTNFLDNAVVEAQAIGKSPDICEPNSLFVQYYTDCLVCSESSGIGVPTDLSSSIDQYTKYGESIGIDPPVAIATTVTITISGRPLGVPITTVLGASNNTASSSLNTTSNSMTSFSNTGTKNPSMRIRQQISKSLHNYEKPQLHSDCVPRPNPHELGNTEVAELPAPVPELRGTEVFPELSDTSRENNGDLGK